MTLLLLILVGLLAFANGANDNAKGVATLVGYGAATPGRALAWATATTALGAGASFWLSGGMLATFSTTLFGEGVQLTTAFDDAVLIGAFAWVAVATFTGLPVSTTHAIIGGLSGAGTVAFGGRTVHWDLLGSKFAVPLALSPVAALALVYLLALPVVWGVRMAAGRCVCVAEQSPAVAAVAGRTATAAVPARQLAVVTGDTAECAAAGPVLRADGSAALDGLHWFSGGLISMMRGWNDTPKIAALAVVAMPKQSAAAFALVTVVMALGGLLAGRRVLETMARKMTALPLAESLTASLASAVLVGLASFKGLPVSTTHVTTGGILGAGLAGDRRGVKWKKVGEIAVSWVVTLPVAAGVSAAAMLVLR